MQRFDERRAKALDGVRSGLVVRLAAVPIGAAFRIGERAKAHRTQTQRECDALIGRECDGA